MENLLSKYWSAVCPTTLKFFILPIFVVGFFSKPLVIYENKFPSQAKSYDH